MKILLPLLLAILASSQCNGLRILGIFPLNGKSHWVMGESLMTSLARRGHQVDVVTHFSVKKPPPTYREILMDGTLPRVVNNMNASTLSLISGQNMAHLVDMAGNSVCQLLGHQKLQELIKNRPKYDLIIVEVFVAPCYLAFGRHLNTPMVGVITTTFHDWLGNALGNPYNPSFTPGLFSAFGQRMTFWERLVNTFQTNVISVKINYYMSRQVEFVKKYFNMDVPIEDLYKDLAVILANSHHSVNGIRQSTTGIIEIGGMHITEEADPLAPDVQKWLDESTHGCIYFTFGSMMRIETFPKPVIETMYKVFEKIAPVRVLMKVAKKEDLLPGLPKNVMTQPWYPQVSVFKHKNIKAFITHGGLMSTQEAIYFGIPLIGIPLFGDQSVNMKNAVNRNIAVNLESIANVTEETFGAAIQAILHDKTYSTSMKKLSVLFKDRPLSAIDTAIYWSEYAAKHGNILQSPGMHLSWWQIQLFDIYAFVLACLAAALYLAVYALRKVKNFVLGCKSCTKKNSKSFESKKRK